MHVQMHEAGFGESGHCFGLRGAQGDSAERDDGASSPALSMAAAE
jgi:hypothetical protein